MYRKVLIPTDFSRFAYRTAECVAGAPGIEEVVMLHIVDASHRRGKDEDHIREAEFQLDTQKNALEGKGIFVKTRLLVIKGGEIVDAIQKVADEEGADLIAMPSRGQGLIEGILIGSVSRDFLRSGKTDFLVMHYKVLDGEIELLCPDLFSRILLTTDFSGPSMTAQAVVKGLTGVRDVDLVNVVSRGESNDEVDENVRTGARMLRSLAEDLKSSGLNVRVHVPVGHPPEEVRRLANSLGASLIVISSRGRGRPGQSLGSTVYDIARIADRPVLVVRAGMPDEK